MKLSIGNREGNKWTTIRKTDFSAYWNTYRIIDLSNRWKSFLFERKTNLIWVKMANNNFLDALAMSILCARDCPAKTVLPHMHHPKFHRTDRNLNWSRLAFNLKYVNKSVRTLTHSRETWNTMVMSPCYENAQFVFFWFKNR